MQVPIGVVAGFGNAVVAAIMGVAGGRAADPDDRAAVGLDIKTAENLALPVSLPTDGARTGKRRQLPATRGFRGGGVLRRS